jgi:hypothetical protein
VVIIIRLDHSVADSKIKVDLHFDIVHECVGDIMLVSLAETLPVLSHGQILNLDLELRDLEQVDLQIGDVLHVEGVDNPHLGVNRMDILSMLTACELLVLSVK